MELCQSSRRKIKTKMVFLKIIFLFLDSLWALTLKRVIIIVFGTPHSSELTMKKMEKIQILISLLMIFLKKKASILQKMKTVLILMFQMIQKKMKKKMNNRKSRKKRKMGKIKNMNRRKIKINNTRKTNKYRNSKNNP